MGKIFIVMGKSATGKDSIYSEIMKNKDLDLMPFVIYTTRPKRCGEENGREYYFSDTEHLKELRNKGRVIEERVYHTVHGDWYYFTADEGQYDENNNYIGIGTLESYVKLKEYFDEGRVIPLYVECDDKSRLLRAIGREANQEKPAYNEVCRRYLADEDDFSEEKIKEARIKKRFENDGTVITCVHEITKYLSEFI